MDSQRRIELQIAALCEVVARMLQEDPEAVLSHARENMQRWGWLPLPEDPNPEHYITIWARLIERKDVQGLLGILSAPVTDQRAIWLRSSSPFAGIIAPDERLQILVNMSNLPDEFEGGSPQKTENKAR